MKAKPCTMRAWAGAARWEWGNGPMAKSVRWRVGVAGLARAGIWRRVRAWQAAAQVELVAVADRDPARRRRALELGVPRVYQEPRELLARESLDLVHVAANPAHQGALIRSALMRGLDVVVEPPVTAHAGEMARLADASRTYGGLLIPLWPAAFDPPWREAPAAAQGAGDPVHLDAVHVVGLDPWWEDLAYELMDDPRAPAPRLVTLGAQGLVHLAIQLLGVPAAVAAWEEAPGPGWPWGASATLLLLYPHRSARLRLAWCSSGRPPRVPGFTLYGTDGRLEGRGLKVVQEQAGGRRLRRVSRPVDSLRPIVESLAAPSLLPRGLDLATLLAVGRVMGALERSAAAAGTVQHLALPQPQRASPSLRSVAAAPATTAAGHLDEEA